jgi:hypothetical protein
MKVLFIIFCVGILIANSELKPAKIEILNNENMLELKSTDEFANSNDEEFTIVDDQFGDEYYR